MKFNALWDNVFLNIKKGTVVDFLRSIALFEGLKRNEIVRLERILHTRVYQKDEKVFSEDEPGAAVYIVQSGKVDIYIDYDHEPILLTTLEAGMFFGELALFDETPRSATVVAAKESTLLALSEPDFVMFSQKEPAIGYKIAMRLGSILAHRLRAANEKIESLTAGHV